MPGDDELTVDFGKVGDWFKRRKKPEQKPAHPPAEQPPLADKHAAAPHEPHHARPPSSAEKSDADISIDFKKVADWFKKKEPTAHGVHDVAGKDELGFDASAAWNWVKKHQTLVVLALVLILQFVPNQVVVAGKDVHLPWGGMYLRLQAEDLPAAEGWSYNHVTTVLKNQIRDGLSQQYPNLPDERKSKLVEEEWQKLYQEQRSQIEQQIEVVTREIKAFWQYDADGVSYTYMPDIDPYAYLRYARNYYEKGHLEDERRDGKPVDNHMIAPLGSGVTFLLQPYVLAWQYRIMRIFSPKITFMQAANYFPIIFILLSLIPAFLIGKKFAGTAGGIVAATMIALMPTIIGRTVWGHADTDPWNILFPTLLTYLYVQLIDAPDTKHILGWGIAAGFTTGLYAWAWMGGWWYVFDFLLAAFAILVASEVYRTWRQPARLKETMKRHALIGLTYFVSAGVFVSLMTTWWDFYNSVFQPARFTIIKVAAHPTLWPNVYTTVAELNPIDFNGIIQSLGGWWYFWIAVAGIVFMLFRRVEGGWKIDLKYAPLLVLWFIATMYASTKGVRFTLLLAPAFAIAFGIALGKIYDWAVRVTSRDFHLNPKIAHAVMILLLAFILSSQARDASGLALGDIPIMNDAWWNALVAIKEDSKPDAIINSWWDFGHHFKYVADRAVTFDGASQNTPMAHWIGRVLSTSNETEAVGILRMLDCGSNNAFDILDRQFQDPVKSVKLLYQLVGVDRKAAQRILAREGVNEQEAVLQNTHCDPPENYFIASDDMIGKSGVWSHFGLWNFERAKLWIVLRNQDQETAVQTMMREWDYTQQQAEQAYLDVQSITNENDANAWISPWLGILGGAADCGVNGDIVSCGNGILHNLSNDDAVVNVEGGLGRPPVVFRLEENGKFKEIRFNDSNMGISVLLYPTGPRSYKSVLGSQELLLSLFVRTYFLEGHGLRHFKEFNRQSFLTGGHVVVYKVDWPGSEPNVFSGLKALKEAKTEEEGKAKEGDTVSVYYTGALLDGTVFDSSIKDWKKKNITIETSFEGQDVAPFTFTIGAGQVVDGFDAAVRGMKPGQEQVAQIPPNAAYGTDPKKHPLGNQTLRFKIKLVKIEKK
jgi:dolichyl-diphosphooligosaccharide--protein glycosyltransferase